jgi:hypothetical protein
MRRLAAPLLLLVVALTACSGPSSSSDAGSSGGSTATTTTADEASRIGLAGHILFTRTSGNDIQTIFTADANGQHQGPGVLSIRHDSSDSINAAAQWCTLLLRRSGASGSSTTIRTYNS